jgi:hypothetical protein
LKIRERTPVEGLGWVDVDSAALPVRIGDRLLPREAFVEFPSDESSPGLRMRLAVVDGVPQCREITIWAKDDGREVRTSDLRAIPLETWIEDLFGLVAARITEEGTDGSVAAVTEFSEDRAREAAKVVQRARAAGRRTITRERLEEVAEIYRANPARPTEAVSRALGVQHTTAAKYVQRARGGGLLPPTTRGKARS